MNSNEIYYTDFITQEIPFQDKEWKKKRFLGEKSIKRSLQKMVMKEVI